MYSITELFCEIVTDEDTVSVKMNLNSPGRIVVKLKNVFQYLKKNAAPLLIAYFLIFGGSGFGFEFEGVADKIIEILKLIRMNDIDIKKAQADLEGQQLENYKKLVELISACNDSNLDIEKIEEQMQIVNELNSTLQFENNLSFAISTDNEVYDNPQEEYDINIKTDE